MKNGKFSLKSGLQFILFIMAKKPKTWLKRFLGHKNLPF